MLEIFFERLEDVATKCVHFESRKCVQMRLPPGTQPPKPQPAGGAYRVLPRSLSEYEKKVGKGKKERLMEKKKRKK